MARLTIVGVRHHSPACARVVREVIARERPAFVLIEGPCDLNDRIDELLLGHRLPIAIYSYLLGEGAPTRGSWTPFCDHSPEWIALGEGRAAGARTFFMDYPAWHDAFARIENRYTDRHLLASSHLGAMAARLGFDSIDALWDHLFEGPTPNEVLELRLAKYFEALRADEPTHEGDTAREAWMARWIAWAMREAGDGNVLAVCGGFHKPALERLWRDASPDLPELAPPRACVGSYLVPFSFHRLDAFAGYASGMPSPGYYQTLWEEPESATDTMLFHVAERLRARRVPASTADLVAASQLTQGLARLRGHERPTRTDLLDGFLGALVKEVLETPLPWSSRGTLPRGTEPILVEIIAAFSGERRGTLAPGTPRPPLLDDVDRLLDQAGLGWPDSPRTLELDPMEPVHRARSRLLHRLVLLGVPGVARTAAPDYRRGSTRLRESWRFERLLDTESTLIERAVYGANLEQAASTRLMEWAESAEGASHLVDALEQAQLAGFEAMAGELTPRAQAAIGREQVFETLGHALRRLLSMTRSFPALRSGLKPLIELAFERGLWLLEGLDGSRAPFDEGDVQAVAALRDLSREQGLLSRPTLDAALATFHRRAVAPAAPPAIQGASLGALWSMEGGDSGDSGGAGNSGDSADPRTTAAAAIRAVPAESLGDFLAGLFVLAREEFLARSLLGIVDGRMRSLAEEEFMIALPALRRAFSFFPPRERLGIAQELVAAVSGGGMEARELLAKTADPELWRQARELENSLFDLAAKFGLLPQKEETR